MRRKVRVYGGMLTDKVYKFEITKSGKSVKVWWDEDLYANDISELYRIDKNDCICVKGAITHVYYGLPFEVKK